MESFVGNAMEFVICLSFVTVPTRMDGWVHHPFSPSGPGMYYVPTYIGFLDGLVEVVCPGPRLLTPLWHAMLAIPGQVFC